MLNIYTSLLNVLLVQKYLFLTIVIIVICSRIGHCSCENNHTSPWDTPLDELKSLHSTSCIENQVDGVIEAEIKWSECIKPFFPPVPIDIEQVEQDDNNEEKEMEFYSYFSHNPPAYKACWNDVIGKLNECDGTERGTASGSIYLALYDDTCSQNGTTIIKKTRAASSNGDLCEHNYTIESCQNRASWTSSDICKRFISQMMCDISAIDNCSNEIHKRNNIHRLEKIVKALGCKEVSQLVQAYNSATNNFTYVLLLLSTFNFI